MRTRRNHLKVLPAALAVIGVGRRIGIQLVLLDDIPCVFAAIQRNLHTRRYDLTYTAQICRQWQSFLDPLLSSSFSSQSEPESVTEHARDDIASSVDDGIANSIDAQCDLKCRYLKARRDSV